MCCTHLIEYVSLHISCTKPVVPWEVHLKSKPHHCLWAFGPDKSYACAQNKIQDERVMPVLSHAPFHFCMPPVQHKYNLHNFLIASLSRITNQRILVLVGSIPKTLAAAPLRPLALCRTWRANPHAASLCWTGAVMGARIRWFHRESPPSSTLSHPVVLLLSQKL